MLNQIMAALLIHQCISGHAAPGPQIDSYCGVCGVNLERLTSLHLLHHSGDLIHRPKGAAFVTSVIKMIMGEDRCCFRCFGFDGFLARRA